ncbi:hypothetical protein ACTHS0_11820, partial [Neisseria sp. P0013.S009]|uniref:hypothetical protein n=1 Tax=Neisseria sp. P0013.S009 TaxID=3436745 RepID=UPI003F7E699A
VAGGVFQHFPPVSTQKLPTKTPLHQENPLTSTHEPPSSLNITPSHRFPFDRFRPLEETFFAKKPKIPSPKPPFDLSPPKKLHTHPDVKPTQLPNPKKNKNNAQPTATPHTPPTNPATVAHSKQQKPVTDVVTTTQAPENTNVNCTQILLRGDTTNNAH